MAYGQAGFFCSPSECFFMLQQFLQADLDAIVCRTGLSETEVMASPVISAEYEIRLRMWHATEQGPLPTIGIIDMLRHLGFDPPARKAVPKALEVNWRALPKGTRVIVSPDDEKPEKQFYGRFQCVPESGFVAVTLDGAVNDWADEYPYRQVGLAPVGTPDFVQPVDATLQSLNPLPAPPVTEPVEADSAANLQREEQPERLKVDRDDPTPNERVPVLTKDWSNVDPGDPVLYEQGDETLSGEFLEEGPTDGHISIRVDDVTLVVPEELVTC